MFKLKTPAHVALGAFVLVMGLGAIGCDTPAKDFVSSLKSADGGVSEGDTKIIPASWVIQGQIKGMDVPTISMRQYNVTDYKPSAWVSQTINACNKGKLILK